MGTTKNEKYASYYTSAVSFNIFEKMEELGVYRRGCDNDYVTYAQAIDFLMCEGFFIVIAPLSFGKNPAKWRYDLFYMDELMHGNRAFGSFREAADDAIMRILKYFDPV